MMLLLDYLLCWSHCPDSQAIKRRHLHPSWADTHTKKSFNRDATERQKSTKSRGWVQLCRLAKDGSEGLHWHLVLEQPCVKPYPKGNCSGWKHGEVSKPPAPTAVYIPRRHSPGQNHGMTYSRPLAHDPFTCYQKKMCFFAVPASGCPILTGIRCLVIPLLLEKGPSRA